MSAYINTISHREGFIGQNIIREEEEAVVRYMKVIEVIEVKRRVYISYI